MRGSYFVIGMFIVALAAAITIVTLARRVSVYMPRPDGAAPAAPAATAPADPGGGGAAPAR